MSLYTGKAKSDLGPKDEGVRVSKGESGVLRAMGASVEPTAGGWRVAKIRALYTLAFFAHTSVRSAEGWEGGIGGPE